MILKPAALLAAIVALTFAGSVFAADPVNIEIMAVEEEPGSMVLTVSAVDENGKPFPGLDPSSFNAWINDQALIVKELHTATDREPASVLLLVDVSSSMAGEPIQQAQVAINEFIDVLEPNDEVAVMSFSEGVNLVQDFTSDRAALDSAVAGLQLTDSTDLYNGVIDAAVKMTEAPRSRRLIVLLSDGVANINQDLRDGSIQTAREAGVSFIAVSLGANTDLQYLRDLTSASGGSVIEAATPAELRAAYTSLAFAIRSQYTLVTEVPRSIDRTIPGTLKVHVIHRADNAFAERSLEPLDGAVPPPFTMSLSGIEAGDRHNGMVNLVPAVQEGIEVAKVDYILDGEVVYTTEGVGAYTLDASLLENGSHVLKVVATDVEGREGEVQVPFLVPVLTAPSEGGGLPIIPILLLTVLAIGGYFVAKFGYKRWQVMNTPTYSRVDTWASRRTPTADSSEEEDSEPQVARPVPQPTEEPIKGRVVIMNEAAVRGGELETILEFDMKSQPLTFGSGPSVDMRVDNAGGLIAAEEARIWVQRGRMVYHKLTTLSAMATEGVTAGWQFLEDGEEMRIGPYRIIFQAQQEEKAEMDADKPVPDHLPQEHGMALHRSFGLTETDRTADLTDLSGEGEVTQVVEEPTAAEEVAPDIEVPEEEQAPASEWEVPSTLTSEEESLPAASSWQIAASEPQSSGWEIETDSSEEASSGWSLESSGTPQPIDWQEDMSGSEASHGEDGESAQPDQWGPTLLEPMSADWLIEQSQPMDDGVGQIVQPGAWSSFVSEEGEDGPAASEDGPLSDEDGPEERAWGT
jgi:VWFA-related protein